MDEDSSYVEESVGMGGVIRLKSRFMYLFRNVSDGSLKQANSFVAGSLTFVSSKCSLSTIVQLNIF